MNRTALMATAAVMALTATSHAYADVETRDASTLTMSQPTRSVVPFGEASRVSGQVSGVLDRAATQEGRSVRMELSTPNGWMPLPTRGVTDARGDYSLKVPASWYYRGKVRTTVSGSDTHAPAQSTSTASVTVRPPYAPRGTSSAWSHLTRDPDARWNPCRVITFKVNPTGGPRRAVVQVKQALGKVAAATGLRFDYTGTTSAIPWRTDGRGRDSSGAALTVAWASPRQVRPLEGATAGWGGGWYLDGEITAGGIALDRTGTSSVKNGFGSGATWGALLLHELAHVMGLGHVAENKQLMYPSIQPSTIGRFEAGDLAGLSDQGAMNGCLPTVGTRWTTSAPRSFATY